MPRAPLATPQEVAGYLRKNTRTLANWRSLGIGPSYVKTGNGSVLYRWDDVDAWLTSPEPVAAGVAG